MRFLIGLSTIMLAGCTGISAAQMRLPTALQAGAESVPVSGMTGWQDGNYQAGAYFGTYDRTLERLRIFDLFSSTRGRAEFTVAGPGLEAPVTGSCGVKEKALVIADVEFKPAPMAFRCDFSADGRFFPARFELQESRRGLAANLTREARRGELAFEGQHVSFRSVHQVQGGALSLEHPIGYVFEQDGQPVGALELNGRPEMILPLGMDPEVRKAVVVASIALATIWDPGQVD